MGQEEHRLIVILDINQDAHGTRVWLEAILEKALESFVETLPADSKGIFSKQILFLPNKVAWRVDRTRFYYCVDSSENFIEVSIPGPINEKRAVLWALSQGRMSVEGHKTCSFKNILESADYHNLVWKTENILPVINQINNWLIGRCVPLTINVKNHHTVEMSWKML